MEKTELTPGINFSLPAEWGFSTFCLDSNLEKMFGFQACTD